MAVERFILDQTQLNDAEFGLDGFSPAFKLDTSTLDSIAKLDGFTFTTTVTASASLGGLTAEAVALVSHVVSAQAVLGGLTSTAVADVAGSVTASALLGELTSSAQATVDPAPSPPAPQYPGGGNPWYRRPKVEKVEEVVQVVVEPLRVPLQVFGVGSSVGSLSSSAVAEVTWSILEDEAELLLLV